MRFLVTELVATPPSVERKGRNALLSDSSGHLGVSFRTCRGRWIGPETSGNSHHQLQQKIEVSK